MLADYHIVRRHKLKLDHLYVGDKTSIYWFRHGINWRAVVVFVLSSFPLLRMYLASMIRLACTNQDSSRAGGES